jgi:RHS repeat-associated protein
VTTVQGGSAIRRYYEPFGAHVDFDGSPAAAPVHDVRHGFTGHAHDDDLGLIDMRGRVYSPSTRQFLTPDPLGRLGASPYSYVRNNPINWIDPSGFTEEDPEGGWYSGFAGLFGSVPVAAIDMSPSLVSQVVASVAAMDFPNGNDAPNSSGCPNGTGTAPRPCAAPGAAGCTPHPREPPTVRQAPPETLSDRVGRILRLEEPPDEIGPYSIAYHIKHGIVDPTRRWIAHEPTVYLDADHNVRTSSVHRDYSHEMAPVLGEVTLMVAPGANALARGFAAREAPRITSGSQVTEQVIREAMKDAPLASQQAGGVSLPTVQNYVDKLLAGEVAPAIKVDGRMIVDGNHRYIAGRILGQEPAIQPWAGGRPGSFIPWDTIPIDPKAWP